MLAHSGQKVEQSNIEFDVEIVHIERKLMRTRSRIHPNRSRIHPNRSRIHTDRGRSLQTEVEVLVNK